MLGAKKVSPGKWTLANKIRNRKGNRNNEGSNTGFLAFLENEDDRFMVQKEPATYLASQKKTLEINKKDVHIIQRKRRTN